ncbi:MucB/RseB C-terminal domain-containing protein [uncultured Rhodoferax sp.]|mgnify:FL=1|uniref:MucB/RseB C-terminal domain-containing protein n=1 Tax=uncultured Rhodoferax sp. TaxID=223188 RepID=UPI0025DF6A23|nr:MucB/RseB C-terminal domain-containing protein [uncultured Rhodoferax sp.]
MTLRRFFLALGLACLPLCLWAQESGLNAWLMRLHEASRHRTYTGTFVVSAAGQMASARIWHVCDGDVQMERVESLSGTPRATFRRNDEVLTFFPESKVAVSESRESLGLFPNLLKSNAADIGEHYWMKPVGNERIAGLDAEVVQLVPKDALRYGYRVWSEKRSGLVVQLQTLDTEGKVLEQAAFSELQLDAPVSKTKLAQMMAATDGYRVERRDLQKTTAKAQGWDLSKPVPGFKPMGCYTRPVALLAGASGRSEQTMQWMFSDGLATVSLFVEAFDAKRHVREGVADLGGATRTQTRRLDGWWITAVGEVPASTLALFAQGLERKK